MLPTMTPTTYDKIGRNVSGTVTIVEVKAGSIHVGHGFILWDWVSDWTSSPIISNFLGNPLPMDMFDITIIETKLALINMTVH
jgi:hypothetical protein